MMTNQQAFGLAMILAAGVIVGAELLLWRFRRNLKEGDIVGINFGDGLILNRTIIAINTLGNPLVKSPYPKVSPGPVDKDCVHFPTAGEPVDEIASGY